MIKKDLVLVWLKSGAIFKDGVLLFKQIFGDDHPFVLLLKEESKLRALVLKQALRAWCKRSGEVSSPAARLIVVKKPKLREDFPFLSDYNCPPELKILAADKITCYHNYVAGHESLFDCHNKEDQFKAVKFTVENFIENRKILKELEYYKERKSVLGDHRIFNALKRLQELRRLKVTDLIALKKNLTHSIWRTKSEIAKKNKPHLDVERELMIKEKESEILQIDIILEGL
jgi:hypothetical protein